VKKHTTRLTRHTNDRGKREKWNAEWGEVKREIRRKLFSEKTRLRVASGEAPLGFRQAPPPPVPMPMSHFLVRPRRAAATRTNAAIDASRRGANVNF
jgi:hypothetical protein